MRFLTPLPRPSLLTRPRRSRRELPLLPLGLLLSRRWTTHDTAAQNQAIEEQTLPFYHRKHYYPVKIGQVFNNRYRIIAKLGYGAYSTVWLAWDERNQKYVSLKVSIQTDKSGASPVLNEVCMLRRLKQCAEKDHPGLGFTRLADDIFEIDGVSGGGGRHYCIASKPQGNSVRTLQETFPDAKLPKLLVKSLIHRLFFAVNWLHASCGVVHTADISPQNVLMEIDDSSSLEDVEEQEARDPSVPVLIGDDGDNPTTVVYKSQPSRLRLSGHPILTDFGHMRLVEGRVNQDWWMSDLYRAPEVLLQLPWGFAVDIWSIGVMTLELMEGKNLFDPVDRVHGQYVLPLALAQYIGYLGLPPLDIIRRSPVFMTYFDKEGNWIYDELPIPKTSLEDFVTTIPPGEEKDQFLRFIRKILTWDPKARATSNEIIPDEWLMRPIEGVV
ncbi:CMGC/SRPK protein kinase [Helicocarpus griseus UAMH5409]|uniref:non-specific serine/threonine protein kinase n=1 Tax=Helicocarpus griseus UAMH5409 TaxID=1447875 RepID=A0A2B7WR52_9EURO|nr:CMGC/SRPK protein kinase [Helicocarpus griseus UAMH5409]